MSLEFDVLNTGGSILPGHECPSVGSKDLYGNSLGPAYVVVLAPMSGSVALRIRIE
jgi:hypothetical protein